MKTTNSAGYYPEINCGNARHFKHKGRVMTGHSMTIPDQSLTIRELISRFTRGMPVTGGADPSTAYFDENELPDPRTLDLVDRENYVKGYSEELQSIQKRLEASKTSKEKEALKQQIKAEFEKEAAEKLAAEQAARNSTNNT